MNIVANNYSLNSCDNSNWFFTATFPDSEIAEKYKMGKAKLACVLNFGISPHLRSILISDIKSSPFFLISFDKSLNYSFENCQMNIIRFWNKNLNQAITRYFDSKFICHPTARNLLVSLNCFVDSLSLKRLTQLAMDGPRTNWVLYDLLCNEREKEENPTLINIGNCGLHIIHGVFKNGVQATNWNISKLPKACLAFFHDSPVRQADSISFTGCDMFPFAFCTTYWG